MNTVIFDLDRTLVRSFAEYHPWFARLKKHQLYKAEIVTTRGVHTFYVVVRSGARRILYLCQLLGYRMGVYSAGQPSYVTKIVDILTYGHPEIFTMGIWNFTHCQKREDGSIVKPLKEIGVLPETTVHVDDDESVLSENPESGLVIPPFSPRGVRDAQSDKELKNVFKAIHKRFT